MISLILAAFLYLSPVQASNPCEWVGPRLDGTTVLVCDGAVQAVALGSDVRWTVRQ